jgi:hypothetical protein
MAPKKRPGRPRTRPEDYHQRSIWIRDKLHADVARALIRPPDKPYEFSRLVEHLLRKWLKAGAKIPEAPSRHGRLENIESGGN